MQQHCKLAKLTGLSGGKTNMMAPTVSVNIAYCTGKLHMQLQQEEKVKTVQFG